MIFIHTAGLTQHYLGLCEARVIDHHTQQYVHNALLLNIRQSNVTESQREDVEEFSCVKLDQCPQVRVERLVDGA